MDDLPDWLINSKEDCDLISKRYNEAWDADVECFGDADDLLKYVSTWWWRDEQFLDMAIKLEKCVMYKKRYKHLYMFLIERIWKSTLGPFIRYRIRKIVE